MRPPLFVLAALALTPAVTHAEFVVQLTQPPATISLQPADISIERARLARANWLRTHRAQVTTATAPQARPGMADGFGKDVPLRVALLQILPPTVTAQYGEGVDADQIVNWSGGKPWQTVLHDVVQPLHLRAKVSGSVVKIDPTQD